MSVPQSIYASKRNQAIVVGAAVLTIILWLVGWLNPLLRFIIGGLIPYAAIAVFLHGIITRVLLWGKSPVPFRIPTTCGQQRSHPWIQSSQLDNPHTTWGVVGRMALEVLFFRSLFRNTKTELRSGPKLTYGSNKFLWAGAMAFHWCFLIIIIRHLRFFTDPIPFFVDIVEYLDSFFQVYVPSLYITDIAIIAALGFLLLRRVAEPKLRYISLPADYFPLILILGIVITGVLMRYVPICKTDVVGVKELAMGLATLQPFPPAGLGVIFYIHLLLVCMLLVYFPYSKLMHMMGVFLSPTRNMANTNRMVRHINPWDYPVKVHTYEEWEDEFRDKMKKAGYDLEKE